MCMLEVPCYYPGFPLLVLSSCIQKDTPKKTYLVLADISLNEMTHLHLMSWL